MGLGFGPFNGPELPGPKAQLAAARVLEQGFSTREVEMYVELL